MEPSTSSLTRGVCTECGETVSFIDYNFLGPEPQACLRPCGHTAALRFEDAPWT